MKVLLLAGGLGSRLSEETINKPKPMVEIGYKPILWHIMKIYSSYGFNDFIILLGYKGNVIKEYFVNYLLNNNVFIDGVITTEYNSSYRNLHNHILLYSDSDFYLTKGMIFNFWKKIGNCQIDKFDTNGIQMEYITKHLYKTQNNNLSFINDL